MIYATSLRGRINGIKKQLKPQSNDLSRGLNKQPGALTHHIILNNLSHVFYGWLVLGAWYHYGTTIPSKARNGLRNKNVQRLQMLL